MGNLFIPVNDLHVRFFNGEVMDPDIEMTEESCIQSCYGREEQSKSPEEQKPVNIHGIPRIFKDPLFNIRLLFKRRIKMIEP